MRLLLIIIISILFLLVNSAAAYQIVTIWPEPYFSGPDIEDSIGMIYVYIVLSQTSTPGLTGVSFSAPLPDCLTGVILISAQPHYTIVGDIESGIDFAFGDCYTTTKTLMTLTLWSNGLVDTCCLWDVLPHPASASGEVEGVDCTTNTLAIGSGRLLWTPQGQPLGSGPCGRPTVPSNPSPPDGAIEQPLNLTLDWESVPTAGTGLGLFVAYLYFGEDPDPPLFRGFIDPPSPQEVGPLLPNTTYYWQILSQVTDYGSTLGPVWHFTTIASGPAKKSTWGAIKGLYRN